MASLPARISGIRHVRLVRRRLSLPRAPSNLPPCPTAVACRIRRQLNVSLSLFALFVALHVVVVVAVWGYWVCCAAQLGIIIINSLRQRQHDLIDVLTPCSHKRIHFKTVRMARRGLPVSSLESGSQIRLMTWA